MTELSNRFIQFFDDPSLILENNSVTSKNETQIAYMHTCEKYDNTIINIMKKLFRSDYIGKFYCSSRILLKQLNIDVKYPF